MAPLSCFLNMRPCISFYTELHKFCGWPCLSQIIFLISVSWAHFISLPDKSYSSFFSPKFLLTPILIPPTNNSSCVLATCTFTWYLVILSLLPQHSELSFLTNLIILYLCSIFLFLSHLTMSTLKFRSNFGPTFTQWCLTNHYAIRTNTENTVHGFRGRKDNLDLWHVNLLARNTVEG